MNRSKLFEWLCDNDCPWEWEASLDLSSISDEFAPSDHVQMKFFEKKEEAA